MSRSLSASQRSSSALTRRSRDVAVARPLPAAQTGSGAGRALLARELDHVVQQRRGGGAPAAAEPRARGAAQFVANGGEVDAGALGSVYPRLPGDPLPQFKLNALGPWDWIKLCAPFSARGMPMALRNADSPGLKGESIVDLANLNKDCMQGKISLGAPGPHAVTVLTASGGMKARFKLGLTGANTLVDGLAIEGTATASKRRPGVTTNCDVKVHTRAIHLGVVSDTSLGFAQGTSGSVEYLQVFPKTLEGTVSSATTDDIGVTTATTRTGVVAAGATSPNKAGVAPTGANTP